MLSMSWDSSTILVCLNVSIEIDPFVAHLIRDLLHIHSSRFSLKHEFSRVYAKLFIDFILQVHIPTDDTWAGAQC